MTSPPAATPRQARMAVMAYAAALFAIAAASFVMFSQVNEIQRDYVEKTALLESLKRRGTEGGAKGAGPAARPAIVAATETLAASELQRQVVERLLQAGGAVRSVQAEPARDAAGDGAQRLVAKLSFDGSITALQALLFDLETGTPFIFVDALAVQPAAGPAAETGRGDRLQVSLAVSSFWTADTEGRRVP